MKDLLIVDGHNYIFNLHREENVKENNIEDLKDQLISDLSAYGTQNEFSIVVVFDAKGSSNNMRSSVIIDEIEVIHSKEGETADSIIEELVSKWSDQRKILVVTSDYSQQKVIFGKNTIRKSSREFNLEINSVKDRIRQMIQENRTKSRGGFYPLEKRLDPEIKKKISKFRKK